MADGCAECGRLRRERDEARTALARAREELEALRMAMAGLGERADNPFKANELQGMPLRYRLVDQLNDGLKRWLKPVHAGGKALAERAGRRRGPRHG
jgi:hypothetical protein